MKSAASAPARKPQIVVLDGYALNPGDLDWKGFEALGELRVHDRTPDELIQSRIGDADCVLTNKTPLGEEVFKACPSLRYIGVLATGYNVVDVAAASRYGITVTNVPDYGSLAVAQFAIALLLEAVCHVGLHDRAVHAGRWSAAADFCFFDAPLMELSGKPWASWVWAVSERRSPASPAPWAWRCWLTTLFRTGKGRGWPGIRTLRNCSGFRM